MGCHSLQGCGSSLEELSILFEIKYVASALLIMMGSMDCLTTVIGTLYFGTVELNPFIAGLLSASVPAFVAIKLAITLGVALVFVFAERMLLKTPNKDSRSFRLSMDVLRATFLGLVLFLGIVVANNISVIIRLLL